MNIIDRGYLEIDGLEIAEVVDISESTEMDSEVVKTMSRRNRGYGVRRGVPHWQLELSVIVPTTGEYDWDSGFTSGVELSCVVQYARQGDRNASAFGPRYRYDRCTITSVGATANAGGEVTRSVTMMALDKVEE